MVCIQSKEIMFWKISWKELNFLIDKFVENGHDQDYLNSIVKENKHQATKPENTTSSNYHEYQL